MAQFVAFASNVEVNGNTVMAIAAGMGPAALPILTAHGLGDIRPDQWYPQQAWLDAFREIAEGPTASLIDLVAIGMAIPDNATFPPDINSMVSALMSIDVAYHMNHRGGEIGHYHANVLNDHQVDLVCENPYPCDFDYGIVYSMARRFQPKGQCAYVYHDDAAPCRKRGDDSCTYHVIAR
jgi:hypothetical protein